jgi:dCTP diphosphatase
MLCVLVRRTVVSIECYVDVMADKSLLDELQEFVVEREWAQFHSPANLAKSISIEAAELLECFQWSDDADEGRVREELADVLTYCLILADRIGVDPDRIVREKLALTREKYPVEKARGRSEKYDAL